MKLVKAVKKPVEISAVWFDGLYETAKDIRSWIGLDIARVEFIGEENQELVILISTLKGTMIAHAGDWIIKGVLGGSYPCKPGIFAATYEIIDEENL